MKSLRPGVVRKAAVILAALSLLSAASIVAGCSNDKKDKILVGFVAPLSGPLAGYTGAIEFIAKRALAEINRGGGIYIKEFDKKLPMEIVWGDSESNAAKAREVAEKLVLEDKVDILVGAWTTATINPVSAVAERHGIPALVSGGPLQSWMADGPYTWVFGNVYDEGLLLDEAIAAWNFVATNRKAGLLFDSGTEGTLYSALAAAAAAAAGFEVFDPGRFPAGTPDYTGIIDEFRREGCDIVVGNMILPDFKTYWGQCRQAGYIPKIMNIGKGLQFNADADAIGPTAEGLTSEVMWNPSFKFVSPLTGQTSEEQGKSFSDSENAAPPATIGYDWSTFETLWQVFTIAQSCEKEALRQALREVDFESSTGRIKFADNVCIVPAVAGQWVKDETWGWKTIILSSSAFPGIPANPELMFPMPGS